MLIDAIATELSLPHEYVANLVKTASFHYKVYRVPKRRDGTREIHHPSKPLKAVQRWLLGRYIRHFPVHGAAKGYRTGTNIRENAAVHAKSKYLLRMDFRDFFPSITNEDLKAHLRALPEGVILWDEADLEVFCRLVCRHHTLTIGAPTSPGLSNALCYDLDTRLTALAETNHCSYSRYADDLFFSASIPNILGKVETEVVAVCADLPVPARLTVNNAKTRHSSKRGKRRVTGLVLTSDGNVAVGRSVKRKIRSMIHRSQLLDGDRRAELAGLIAYTVGIDPEFMNSLIKKYGHARVEAARMGR